MDQTRVRAFREEAARQGLIVLDGRPIPEGTRYFEFDINQGIIRVPDPTAERVARLVNLARDFATTPPLYGEHIDLLICAILRTELATNQQTVRWQRRIYVHNDSRWVNLLTWLEDNGQYKSVEEGGRLLRKLVPQP